MQAPDTHGPDTHGPDTHGPDTHGEAGFDVVVLGAGGAGLLCAATAGQRGMRVCVLDHADRPGRKILISGGGRCNFTNLETTPDRYLSNNRHFAKSALRRYTQHDFIALVDRHGIAWHEKTLGQLFCDGRARQIVDMLLAECDRGGVRIALQRAIKEVSHADGLFRVRTDHGTVSAPALVIATGGPSIPKMGATGFAYDLARQFGLQVVRPRPALVPLTLDRDVFDCQGLAGVATPVVAHCGKARFEEAALFTHRGLSGPAILQISSYWSSGASVSLDFAPHQPRDWLIRIKKATPRARFKAALSRVVPERLAMALSELFAISGDLANTPDKALTAAAERLARFEVVPTGTEGYAKAEVTAGGIDTDALSSRTMEAKAVPGLYAIGEAVDVTGWLGGYNFQWAWSSGVAAGEAIAEAKSGR